MFLMSISVMVGNINFGIYIHRLNIYFYIVFLFYVQVHVIHFAF